MLKLVFPFLIACFAFAQVVLPGGPPPVVPPPPPNSASAKKLTAALAETSGNAPCVVELKTGQRIEGAIKQTTAAGAVIEVAGQSITIPLEKLKAIYFGAAGSVTVAVSAPFKEALDALKALRSVTNSGVTFGDYSQRVLDSRVKVDRYFSSPERNDTERRRSIRAAMLEYEVMRYSLNPVLGEKEKSMGAIGKIVGDAEVIATCSVLKNLTDVSLSSEQRVLKDVLRTSAALSWRIARIPHTPDQDDDLGLTFLAKQITPLDMWSCAAAQIAEAERALPKE